MSTENSPYLKRSAWFKGSVHSHTTASDGALTPAESIRKHRQLGYDFVAISDHRTITDTSAFSGEGFLTIPAGEFGGVVGIDITKQVRAGDGAMAEQISEVVSQGGLAVVAHPHWSGLTVDRIKSLGKFDGMEIFNNGVEVGTGNGYAAELWDLLLSDGLRIWGFAVDDAHHKGHSTINNGWIMVHADQLSREQIVGSIRSGNFYSTQGPEFHSIDVDSPRLSVRTSPVRRMKFISTGVGRGRVIHAQDDEPLTKAEIELDEKISWNNDRRYFKYVRIEIEDQAGRRAWSNPIFL